MICPICFYSKPKKIFIATNRHGSHQLSTENIPIYKCLNCGCIFPKVTINKNYYQKFYPSNYYSKQICLPDFRKYLFKRPGHLLDVGCGQGEFIYSLPKYITPTGIDINAPNSKNLINSDFLKHNFKRRYDYITFWHSLEHFQNPRVVIKKALSLLKKDGILYISIPNTSSLAFRFGREYWFHLDSPRHLFLPNNKNIKLLFPANYSVKTTYNIWSFPLDLFHSLKKYPYLRFFYPILKLFDKENMLIKVQESDLYSKP